MCADDNEKWRKQIDFLCQHKCDWVIYFRIENMWSYCETHKRNQNGNKREKKWNFSWKNVQSIEFMAKVNKLDRIKVKISIAFNGI